MIATVEKLSIDCLDNRAILRYLGYRGQELDDAMEGRMEEGVSRCLELIRPRASWRAFPIASRRERPDGCSTITLDGCTLILEGKSIARHLDGALQAVVLAVSVGLGIDRELQRLSLTDPVAQSILDAAGTEAVEQAAGQASAHIRTWAEAQGLATGARFSPGYGDLPLSCQTEVLACVDAGRALGISLSESLLMSPVKSVTAIIGVFEAQARARRASRASGAEE